jgi:glycosyltransferase involved in cell wall biosynthesis
MRLAVVASHPIQYYAPLFRVLAQRLQLMVFFAHRASPSDQAKAGFGVAFDWDIDLLSGYPHRFLTNVAKLPGVHHFAGCDTPEIGLRLKEGCFDAVLVQGWNLKSFLQSVFAAKRQGLPVLARGDSHLGTSRSALKRAAKATAYPSLLGLFDAALYVGQRSRAYWTHYRYPSPRLFFSPHCVDAEWFAERANDKARIMLRARLGISPESRIALFAGKLLPFKRPLDLVNAVALLKTQGRRVGVLVAGAGPLEHEMSAAANAAGVALYQLGFCNQSAMPAAYAAADVLVLPSDGDETWGLVANEALACCRPVILSDAVGAAPDLVGDGMAGHLFPVGNTVALAESIGAVVACPPPPERILAKSAAYSLDAAVDGIVRAVAFVTRRTHCAA